MIASAYGCALAGALLWLFPSDPDADFTHSRTLGVFLLTLFFVSCIMGWGRLITRLTRLHAIEPLSSLALGSAAAALAISLFGHLGMLGPAWSWPELACLALGPAIGLRARARGQRPTRILIAAASAVGVCLGMRLLVASLAQGTSDPFLYHLLAPRFWWDHGRIMVPSFLPVAFQSTYWSTFWNGAT